MQRNEQSNGDRPNQILIGRLEIGLGIVLFAWSTLISLLADSYPALKPGFLYGLSPLILMFSGLILLTAGGGVLKFDRWPYAMHIPLVLWLVFVLLAWL